MVFFRLLGLASIALATPTLAQSGNGAARLNDMLACRSITDSMSRLDCFDRAVALIGASQAKGDLVVLDRNTVIAGKQARFGLAQPKTDVFGGGAADQATAFTALNSTVRLIKPAAITGRWNMTLADGSIWQTIDIPPLPPKAGAAIMVRQAALGGYRATIGRQRSILVKRLR